MITHPKITLIVGLLLTAIAGLGLLKLEINTDGALLYPTSSEMVQQTYLDQQTFHQSQELILLLSSVAGDSIFKTNAGLLRLKSIHDHLSKLPEVDGQRIRSVVNQIYVPNPDRVKFKFFLEEVPDNEADFQSLFRRIRDFPVINGLYLSKDFSHAAIYLSILEPKERIAFIQDLEDWISKQEEDAYQLRLLGVAAAESTLGTLVLRDLAVLIPIAVCLIILLLFLFLRTQASVIVVLFEVGLVLIWVFGMMGHFHVPVTIVTTVLPVLLVAVAITDEIHLLERIEKAAVLIPQQSGSTIFYRELKDIIIRSLSEIRLPLILTSVTTAVGFLTFLTSDIAPLRHFGLFAAIGIIVAMILTFTLIPSLLMVLPHRLFRQSKSNSVGHRLELAGKFVFQHHLKASWIVLICCLLAIPALLQLKVQDSWIENFGSNSSIVEAEKIYNDHFWGSYACDVILDGDYNYFYQREGMLLVEELQKELSRGIAVGGNIAYLTALDRVSAIMDKGPSMARLKPAAFDQVFQMIKFVNPVVGLNQWISANGDKVRVRMLVQNPDYEVSKQLMDFTNDVVAKKLDENEQITFHLSGDIPLAVDMVHTIVNNQLKSLCWTIFCIFLILLIVLRPTDAFLTIIPVLIAGLMIFEVIGLSGMNLGITTSMFATITICIGIDFAVFIVSAFRDEIKNGKPHARAIASGFEKNSRAIGMNTLILASGYFVLIFSGIKANQQLGLLLALALITSYIVTMTTLPMILKIKHLLKNKRV